MGRTLAFLYGVISYLVFLLTFLYAIAFVGNFPVPRSIDTAPPALTTMRAIIMDLILLTLFALQHSIMARPAFKRWWTKFVPRAIERSTFVLFSSLALILLFWQWRSMADPIWTVNNVIGRYALWTLFFVGWGVVLLSTYLINHFDLFGLKQVNDYRRGLEYKEPGFVQPFLYKFVRHPIMLGFIIAFWATPQMSVGHLLFAAVTTAYILVAIQIEERDIVNVHGEVYEDYRRQVSMIVPIPKKKRSDAV
jgi:protein-S-isoprenylcysteine O-methyltransferase Ste14